MSHILEKISLEIKEVYLLGDFNINLLNYETDRPTAEFLFPIPLSQLALHLDQKC